MADGVGDSGGGRGVPAGAPAQVNMQILPLHEGLSAANIVYYDDFAGFGPPQHDLTSVGPPD